MRRIVSLVVLLFQAFVLQAQLIRPFTADDGDLAPSDANITTFESRRFNKPAFDALKSSIPELTSLASLKASSAMIELPMADGSWERLFIAENHVLSTESAALYPLIKNYRVTSADGSIYGSITYSQMGFSVMLFTEKGRQYTMPFSNSDPVHHAVYFSQDYKLPPGTTIDCKLETENTIRPNGNTKYKTTATLGDCTLRNYKMAIAATGEFTTWAGSQANAVASITTTIANVNVIYERDNAIHFILVIDNDAIFTNPAADPYSGSLDATALNTNTATLTSEHGTGGYDVGAVFNNGWNGGLAYTPAVCDNTYKGGAGAGVTGNPQGSIMENVVAHEVGHMFSALHTMSSGTGAGCLNNVTLSTAYEPGGGSSLMAYAGSVCSGQFYQNYTDGYFHYNSASSILSYAENFATCNTTTANSNTAPVLTVPGNSYTIPKSTPFELTASVTDAGATATPTYTFDQYDLPSAIMTAKPQSTNTDGPVFRSYPPSTNAYRIFPPLANVLANTTPLWEVLPSVSRTLNFKIIARDNEPTKGCVAQESVAVTVDGGSGPFAITSQNTTASFTANGSNTIALTWNVASSDQAPVSAANVDILFSTDNGVTFPHTLLAGTANDGSESVIVPNLTTNTGRIKVKGTNNIFFDINNAVLGVTTTCSANGATFTPATNVSAAGGAPALNLGLSPVYGSPLTITGTLQSTDPAGTLTVHNNTAGPCINFGNQFKYNLFTFQVSATGSYTFTRSGGTDPNLVFNVYQNSYTAGCSNFVASNGTYDPVNFIVNINSSYSVTLTQGATYVMAVGTFDNGTPSLPAAYTINVTPPGGGGIYNGVPNPGAGFDYKYVIVNNATGNIVAISASSDMTNSGTYGAGTYKVYGLSVSTGASLGGYVGGSFSTLQTALLQTTICGNLSINSITVTITSSPATWTGATSTSWNTASNWSPASVPTSSSDVTVPSSAVTNELTVDGTFSASSFSVASGRTVTITSPNTLSLTSSYTNNGTISGTGKVILNGSSAQTLSGTGTISNLELNNTSGATISSGIQSLTGLLSVTSGTLTTGGNLTLKSTSATNAAMVGNVTGSISGNVNVERYISETAGGSATGRAWRLVTLPVKGSSNNSVFYNWQNNGTGAAGNGVEIWGPSGTGSGGNGLATGPGSSMRTYNNTGNAYVAVTNTKTTDLFDASTNKAFLLFVSGHYGSNFISAGSDPTVLKGTGSLITGPHSFSFTPPSLSNNFQLVGNPYACPIDFDKVYAHSTNISRKFWAVDPNLNNVGGYATVSWNVINSTYDVVPASSQNQYIQNGQAFFVEAPSVALATVQVQEADKETAAAQTAVFRTNGGLLETMHINLKKIINNVPVLVDGALINCHQTLSNSVGAEDALKIANFNENLSISNGTTNLAIEGRSLFDDNDSVKIALSNLQQTSYQLDIQPANINAPGLTAVLIDNFLNTNQPLSLSGNTIYPFSVTSNPASSNNSRFKIQFQFTTPLDVKFLSLRAEKQDNSVNVLWSVASNTGTRVYEVERSLDGSTFHKIGEVKPAAGTEYSMIDADPSNGKNFYRIKAVARSTSGVYSNTVLVNMSSDNADITTFPNPVNGGSVQINLSNLAKGKYTISIFNAAGQKMGDRQLDTDGGTSSVSMNVENFAAGIYFVRLANDQGATISEQKLIRH